MIEFVWPWVGLLLPLPYLVWKLAPEGRSQEISLRVPSLAPYRSQGKASGLPRRLPIVLFLCWSLLLLGVARPEWVGEPRPLPTAGRDLLLAVDISGSMGEEDMMLESRRLSRLDLVKLVLSDFIERRKGDRVGLILFGTRPYVQAPLTLDRDTVSVLLGEAPLGIAGGRTAIGDAIGLAIKRLINRRAESRVLVLLTDGASNTGELSPERATEIAADAGIRIHTIGFSGLGKRFFGFALAATDVDEESLRTIAETTGGRYFRAESSDELEAVYRLIDELEPTKQDPDMVRPVTSYAHVPIALAWFLGCLLLVARRFTHRIA